MLPALMSDNVSEARRNRSSGSTATVLEISHLVSSVTTKLVVYHEQHKIVNVTSVND